MADLQNPPLNVQPLGLLSFLQLKNGGQFPQHFGRELLPSWDLADHYLQTNGEQTIGNQTVYPAGFNVVTVMAVQPYWRWVNWLSMMVTVAANAADLIEGDFIARPASAGNTAAGFIPPGPDAYRVSATQRSRTGFAFFGVAALATNAHYCMERFWLPAGFTLQIQLNNAVNSGTGGYAFSHSVVHFRS